MNGLSVIICCFNSRERIYKTLECLSRQKVSYNISWEVIVIDNASTDKTTEFVLELWEKFGVSVPIAVKIERRPGQMYARNLGVKSAKYDFLLFCDDDNWLKSSYIEIAYNLLSNDSSIGACGGLILPVFEGVKPSWFDKYYRAYAVGSQSNFEGVLENNLLFGAGLVVRKSVLVENFNSILLGRKGNELSSGDDAEICLMIKQTGNVLYYSPELIMEHFIEEKKLTEDYLLKLYKGFGRSSPYLKLYNVAISDSLLSKLMESWFFHSLYCYMSFLKVYFKEYNNNKYIVIMNKYAYKEVLSLKENYKSVYRQIKYNLNNAKQQQI